MVNSLSHASRPTPVICTAGDRLVLDFDYAGGDRVRIEGGTSYTVSQIGANTLVDLGNGDVMTLIGVQANTLPAGWIFAA